MLEKKRNVFPSPIHHNSPYSARDVQVITHLSKSLHNSEYKISQFRSIFENVSDGLVVMDLRSGGLLAANPAYCQMHGYSCEEILKLDPFDLIPSYHHAKFLWFLDTVRSGEEFTCEASCRKSDGTPFYVEIKSIPFLYEGQISALSVVHDVTERTLLERSLQEKNACLQDTLVELQRTQTQMVQTTKMLTSMAVGTIGMDQVVNSLHCLARMDEAEIKTVDLHDGIESTLMLLRDRLVANDSEAGRGAITIQRNYGNIPPVRCYPSLINQVFMNILTNAIDAFQRQEGVQDSVQDSVQGDASAILPQTQAGDLQVGDLQVGDLQAANSQTPNQITITTAIVDSDWVQVAIANNGPSIPPNIQDTMFEPFFTTKPVGIATGMGLSISHQIITERHRGTLTCSSSPTSGTEFVFHIPLGLSEDSAPKTQPRPRNIIPS